MISPTKKIKVERIQRAVAEYFGISLENLLSPRRTKCIAFARNVAIYLTRKHTNLSLNEIGRAFSGRDHSTIFKACQGISKIMEIEQDLRVDIESLENKIGTRDHYETRPITWEEMDQLVKHVYKISDRIQRVEQHLITEKLGQEGQDPKLAN